MAFVIVGYAFLAVLFFVAFLPNVIAGLVEWPAVERFEINDATSPSVVIEIRQAGWFGWLETTFGKTGPRVQTLTVSQSAALFEGAAPGMGITGTFRHRVGLSLTEISKAMCVPTPGAIIIGVETRKGYVRAIRFRAAGSERALMLERAERAVERINGMLPFPRR